ncbi:hypothetical protein PABG_04946 [Paracoccidioides brasiliensis Pb03]|nr:hypothetical protein PABG_04946 [Paracoccidioides brasiliensis Pb03]
MEPPQANTPTPSHQAFQASNLQPSQEVTTLHLASTITCANREGDGISSNDRPVEGAFEFWNIFLERRIKYDYKSYSLMTDDPNRNSGQRARSQRSKPRVQSKSHVQSAALLGASLAFDGQGANKSTAAQTPNSPRNPRSLATMRAVNNRFEPEDDEPVEQDTPSHSSAGIVEDRIKLFTETHDPKASQATSSRGANVPRPGMANPQHMAAQLAVGRSAVRKSLTPSTKESGGVSSLGQKTDQEPGHHDRIPSPSASLDLVRRNAAGSISKLDVILDMPLADPRVSRALDSKLSGTSSRNERTGSSLSSSSFTQEMPHTPPAEHQRKPSSTQDKQGPPLPPRLPAISLNKPHPSQQAVPAKNQIKMSTTAEDKSTSLLPSIPTNNSTATTRSTNIQTTTPTTKAPPPQILHSRPSRSSLLPQHSGVSDSSLAGALAASSRAPSPAKRNPPPPPPPQRGSRFRSSLNPVHNIPKGASRTPSPPKVIRQTMRQDPKTDDEAERRKKLQRNRIIKTHPNKHREGDRKRWRDRVTERERKRYEGVWAANKGLLINEIRRQGSSSPSPQDMVLNLVVRDIWTRSRLQLSILEHIWNLVSHENRRMLTRQEFVVGMWLIDQCLKGRKLPVKVSQSVWDSVQQLPGVPGPPSQALRS